MTLLCRVAADLTTCSDSSDFLFKFFDYFENDMEISCEGKRNPYACPSVRFNEQILMLCVFFSLYCRVQKCIVVNSVYNV